MSKYPKIKAGDAIGGVIMNMRDEIAADNREELAERNRLKRWELQRKYPIISDPGPTGNYTSEKDPELDDQAV